MKWIIDSAEVGDNEALIVCAIRACRGKRTYLYKPELMRGWEFKRLLAGCYAAIPMPEWQGLTPESK